MEGLFRRCRPALAAAFLLFLVGCDDDPTGGDGNRTIQVEVVDFSFRPRDVAARVGDTIRFVQRDPVLHTATTSDPAPDDPGGFNEVLEDVGDTEEVELTVAGTISYFCIPHPNMTGTIVVTD